VSVKKCQVCSAPATVFLTQVINGKTTELAFCRSCAEEKGYLKPDIALTISEALNAMGLPEAPTKRTESKSHTLLTCGTCGMTFDEFVDSEHLGCSDCYKAFADELHRWLPSLENASKASSSDETPEIRLLRNRIRLLENKLAKAVKEEDFDLAIDLQKQIADLNSQLPR
jgi:protein arginine kinase activator